MDEKKRSLLPGFGMILGGVWLLSRRFFPGMIHWPQVWPVLLICLSVLLFVDAIQRRRSGSLFWAMVLLSVGLFFLLQRLELIPYFHSDEYWPIFLIAFGLGFTALFVYNPRDWGVLIPAGICFFIGLQTSSRTLQRYIWNWEHILSRYWPVLFIAVGIVLLVRSDNHDGGESA